MLLTLFFWLALIRIKFRLLRLRFFRNALFREVSAFSFLMRIRTRDERFDQYLSFENGKVRTFSQADHEIPANVLTVTFNNTSEAFSISKEVRQEKEKIFEFIQQQKVVMEGDFAVLQTIFSVKEVLDKPS